MKKWFIVKLNYTKQNEDGSLQRVVEAFLFDASSFVEAETRAIQEVAESIKGEVLVRNISRASFAEVIMDEVDSDTWFEVKAMLGNIDADTEKAKRVSYNVLVNAPDIEAAISRTKEKFNDSISEFSIVGAKISPIVEVYPYEEEEEEADFASEFEKAPKYPLED